MFRKRLFFFGLLVVVGDRGKVRKLKRVVERKVRGRVGRVRLARVRLLELNLLALENHQPAGTDLLRCADGCVARSRLEPRGASKVRRRSVFEKCEKTPLLS